MNLRPVIDAGPALNFFSTNRQRLLLATLGPICAPETVRDEVLHKARTEARFEQAERVWNRLPLRLLEILSDEETPELNAVVTRISQLPMAERSLRPKDYGETMVIAHAVVAAEAGHTVTVLIDDAEGTRLATTEIERLNRLRTAGAPVGAIRLVGTTTVLERAAGSEHLPDKAAMRKTYEKLRLCDNGLMPIERTRLLSAAVWRPRP